MANTEWWWYIIIWITDSWNIVWIDQKSYSSFDYTDISKFLKKYVSPEVKFNVAKNSYRVWEKFVKVVVIEVLEFVQVPHLLEKTMQFDWNGKSRSEWSLFIRSNASSWLVKSADDMISLIDRAATNRNTEVAKQLKDYIWPIIHENRSNKEHKMSIDNLMGEIDVSFDELNGQYDWNLQKWYFDFIVRPYLVKKNWFLESHQLKSVVLDNRVIVKNEEFWDKKYPIKEQYHNLKEGWKQHIWHFWWTMREALYIDKNWVLMYRDEMRDDGSVNQVFGKKDGRNRITITEIIHQTVLFILYIKNIYACEQIQYYWDVEFKVTLNGLSNRILTKSNSTYWSNQVEIEQDLFTSSRNINIWEIISWEIDFNDLIYSIACDILCELWMQLHWPYDISNIVKKRITESMAMIS